MKIIVAGGRDFANYAVASYILSEETANIYSNNITIVCGKARGADSMGERWARESDIHIVEFPADWNRYGKRAGYLRNEQMALYADKLIAFWDGSSRGTRHMIDLAYKHGLEVVVYNYTGRRLNG